VLRLLRRCLAVSALGLWLGGLTFYSLVVIRNAHRELGNHTRVGFITRRVTAELNLIAAGALAVLLVSLRSDWKTSGRGLRAVLGGSWVAAAAAQVALFVMHPRLEGMLDVGSRTVSAEGPAFYRAHEAYLIVTAVQWAAGLVFLGASLAAWRAADATRGRTG
jgi:hypothetical protein